MFLILYLNNKKIMTLSDRVRHFFHVVSNIRPVVWIGLYVALTPVFALIYMWLPDGQFRIPAGGSTDFGSWLYYSIVTISTLGFGDYTPSHGWAQLVTAIEVLCGLIILGLFLNAVGSMKSEIDVASEIEKQRHRHFNIEKEKLLKSIPSIINSLNTFLAYCYAITTPVNKRTDEDARYNPDFSFNDMADLFKPSGLPIDHTSLPVVVRLLKSASQTSLALDSLQTRVDISLWHEVVDDCFSFVANYQMFSSIDSLSGKPTALFMESGDITEQDAENRISKMISEWKGPLEFKNMVEMQPVGELYFLIKDNAAIALKLEAAFTKIANEMN